MKQQRENHVELQILEENWKEALASVVSLGGGIATGASLAASGKMSPEVVTSLFLGSILAKAGFDNFIKKSDLQKSKEIIKSLDPKTIKNAMEEFNKINSDLKKKIKKAIEFQNYSNRIDSKKIAQDQMKAAEEVAKKELYKKVISNKEKLKALILSTPDNVKEDLWKEMSIKKALA